MAIEPITTQADLGKRIALARDEAGLTQAELASTVNLDRTALAKLEAGTRKVSATELIALAAALDRPIDWFAFESPPAVVSRRHDPSAGGLSAVLDRTVERLGRDIDFLVDQGVLATPTTRQQLPMPKDFGDAEQLADKARALMGVPTGPLHDLQSACEQVDLMAFAIDLGESGGDAAYIEVDSYGVALVNGATDPGRRRFNLAHELGHHLVGDAYAPEAAITVDGDTERLLNVFAAHLLMPRGPVTELWNESASQDQRLAAVAISAGFRTSWSATCGHLRNLDLIDAGTREYLMNAPPRRGDYVELGVRWVAELEAPSVPSKYGRRVVGAFRAGKLTASRTVELLWGTVNEIELPDLDEIPIEGLQREFEPLR